MLTKQEWRTAAEFEAARVYGKKYARWFAFRRFAAGPLGVIVLAGALGGGAYWVWHHVHLSAGGSPSVLLPAAVILMIATAVAFRPRTRFVPAARLILKVAAFGVLWLAFLGYAISSIL